MPTRGNTKLSPFYFPWPLRNIPFARQIDQSRENTEKLAPLVRSVYVDPQPITANDPGNHDIAGFAHGMRDFRNKYRIWYDQDNLRWALQHNSGTEAIEVWDDVITARESDGRVTIEQFGGLQSIGGFYTAVPRNLAVSSTFNPASTEWVFNHNLDTKPILWQAFNMEDKSATPQSVDVSDPNTAYFYWAVAQAGRAIAVAEQARGEGINISDGTNIFNGATRLGFNPAHFYLSNEGHGDPVVNLQNIDINNFDTSSLVHVDGSLPFTADQSMGGNQLTNVGTPSAAGDVVNKSYADALRLDIEQTGGVHAFTDIDKIVFDSQSFYFDTTSGGQPIIGLRGTLGGAGNTAAAGSFTASTEWQLAHNLNNTDITWAVYDDQGLAIIPNKVSVHDPNTAYFYFGTNAMTGRAVVTAAGGTTTVDTSALIHKDGSVDFTGNQSMGGFKLTNVGTPTANGDATNKSYVDQRIGPGFYGVIFRDNVHVFRDDTLVFNSNNFYLSETVSGKPVVNLRYEKDYIPIFDETPSVHNIVVDPWAPYDYTIETVRIDTKGGSLTCGFYVMSGEVQRNKNGTSIVGLDPITASTTFQTLTPSANNNVARGDMVVLSISAVSSPKHLRVQITAQKP